MPNLCLTGASLVAQLIKNQPAMWETCVWSLGWEDPLQEGMATHSSILAWRISMDKGAWRAAIHGVAKSQTGLSDFTFTFHFHALEKEMATHSSVLAWRIPWMEKPGRLLSMESHRVRHYWSDAAAAAAAADRQALKCSKCHSLDRIFFLFYSHLLDNFDHFHGLMWQLP